MAELELALNDDSIKAEAGEILRSLIARVLLTPTAEAPDGIDAQLHGDLAAVLGLSDPDKQKLPAAGAVGSQLSVVAGVSFFATRRYLPSMSAIVQKRPAAQAQHTTISLVVVRDYLSLSDIGM